MMLWSNQYSQSAITFSSSHWCLNAKHVEEKIIIRVCGPPVFCNTSAVFYRDWNKWSKVKGECSWNLYCKFSTAMVVLSAVIYVEKKIKLETGF